MDQDDSRVGGMTLLTVGSADELDQSKSKRRLKDHQTSGLVNERIKLSLKEVGKTVRRAVC